MFILGLCATSHDTSACLIKNGHVISAVAEERVSRIKHDRSFPINAINALLKSAGLSIDDIHAIGINYEIDYHIYNFFYDNDFPISKDEKQRKRIKTLLNLKEKIRERTGFKKLIIENRHHLCHLRAAQYQSGFEKSILLSIDGMGEIATSSSAIYENNLIKDYKELEKFPHSLGLAYAAITTYLGWKYASDEGIVMGLACYGDANAVIKNSNKTYIELFRDMIKINDNGLINLNLEYFDYQNRRNTWVSEKFIHIFGDRRHQKEKVNQIHKNIAAGLQTRLEEILEERVNFLTKSYPTFNSLCITGGVALNCSNNGKIRTNLKKKLKKVFVQPASSDDGTAIGAALLTYDFLENNKQITSINSSLSKAYLGPKYSDEEISQRINEFVSESKKCDFLYKKTAQLLLKNKIIGWYQGRSEFGPRALGNRSILARPFPASNKDYINEKVKFREEFRPFAPVVLQEEASKYFLLDDYSPHMMYAINATKLGQEKCPATVHIDNSCRVQTINRQQNLRMHYLLSEFYKISEVPVLLNTSFNIKGQPIVESPYDALNTFANTALDCLVIGDYLLIKEDGFIKTI